MGVSAERHDVHSYETQAGRWIGFRQSVFRRYAEIKARRDGQELDPQTRSHEHNPGEVSEENEFWIDLSWKIDPDGSLGIRKWFEGEDGNPITLDDYYGRMFAENVPGPVSYTHLTLPTTPYV